MKIAPIAMMCAVLAAAPAPPPSPRAARVAVRIADEGDAQARPVFQATLDRGDARILRTLTPADPQMVLVVLDMVGDPGLIDPAREALAAAIERLPASTSVGLLRAQDGLSVLADPSADRAPVLKAIRELPITGRPGLLETIDEVEQLADSIGRAAQVRVAVLYVTDSNVSEYREDLSNPVINSSDPHDLSRRFPETLVQEKMSKLATRLAPRQTPLHIVHLAYRADRLNEAYQNGLKQLSEMLTGSVVFCRSQGEIADAVQKAMAEIASEYALILALPERAPQSLQVQISAGDTRLLYRTRLELKEKR